MRHDFYAYMDRMKYIKRWQLMRSVREENIMEHSQAVTLFAHALAVIHNDVFGGSADVLKTVLYATYHETSEVMTGDLPTPIKYYNQGIQGAYKKRSLQRFPRKCKARLRRSCLRTKTAWNTSSSRRRIASRRTLSAWKNCVRAILNFPRRKRALKRIYIPAICLRLNTFSNISCPRFR